MKGQEEPYLPVFIPGPQSQHWGSRLRAVECRAFEYRRLEREEISGVSHAPLVYAQAFGSNVIDVDGNRYVDLAAGFGALLLGHGALEIQQALLAQSARLSLALGDIYGSEEKVRLLERLAALYPGKGGRVLLGLSGADAITAAMKTAVLATGKSGLIAFRGGYHGLSHGPLAACGLHDAFRTPFKEQLASVAFAPFPKEEREVEGTLAAVSYELQSSRRGAIIVEPILGRGGCFVPPSGFLSALRQICDQAGALLICDEIWTGLGRSGAWLLSLEEGVVPDLICLGKGLGGGLPISACIGSEEVMSVWGCHGGGAIHTATHFGSPLTCACALALLDALVEKDLIARSFSLGEEWRLELSKEIRHLGIKSVSGRGLMIGIEVHGGQKRALAVIQRLLRNGYLVLSGGEKSDSLILTPALNIERSLLTGFHCALVEVLRAIPF
ncbi:aminotransferase class III-fold pyridoxal phosphate-dependent enzyme [Pajaroellobacter abortibovis]|uniref:4-aminobutyrate aminotransferase n=1 Tax=Pajaroellobacter abortibovis TaxID=1882918 RepID=A0A1L6MYJ1_9BACT|nr:aminotransferase class III-fold pyridoxal phosphate-dependent enzyme [Pajaroellobacter abortibovis]APS00478.1 hypothetical protein BCY86_07160 [Pajaroellobacter abortibovis]